MGDFEQLREMHQVDQALAKLLDDGTIVAIEVQGIQAFQLTQKGVVRSALYTLLGITTQADIERRVFTPDEEKEIVECVDSLHRALHILFNKE